MRRWLVPMMVCASTGLVLSVTGLAIVMYRQSEVAGRDPFEPDELARGLEIPAFSMVDQHGAPASESLFMGRVTILDFIFTNCPFICPGMTMAMSELGDALSGTPVRFMSISVDPAHDTPERLREFASAHGADLTRWSFLTGDRATVERIVRGALQFELQADPSREVGLPDGSKMANIVHPGKLILVGPTLKVIGMYDPNRPEEMRALLARAKLAGAAVPK